MESENRQLVETAQSSDHAGERRTYAYGQIEIVKFLPESARHIKDATPQVSGIFLVTSEAKRQVWCPYKGPGIRNVLIVHPEFGPTVLSTNKGVIFDGQFLESLVTGQPATVDMTARVKRMAEKTLGLKANFSQLEHRALEAFDERVRQEDADRASEARELAERQLEAIRQKEEARRKAREVRREQKVKEIFGRGKTYVVTSDGHVLWGYEVHGDDWHCLPVTTPCVTGVKGALRYFEVDKTKGGRLLKKHDQHVVIASGQAAKGEQEPAKEVVPQIVKIEGRDHPIAVFGSTEEMRTFLRANPGQVAGREDEGGMVQLFQVHHGALTSLGHHQVAA